MKEIIIILVMVVLPIFVINAYNYEYWNTMNPEKLQEMKINNMKDLEFTEQRLEILLKEKGVSDSRIEIIMRQAILETFAFTSNIYNENNNLFGMKHPRVRDSYSKGINRGHAVYDNWVESVLDYIIWMDYFADLGYCQDNYYQFLEDVGYATDFHYIDKLQTINYA